MSPAVAASRALSYARSRAGYPEDVVGFVAARLGSPVGVIADVGCGTGLSAVPFQTVATTLVGVEPDPDMRHLAERELGDTAVILDGTAEAIPLAAKSVDLIVAASCFEWFRRRSALAEFHRVLRPAGSLLVMWNHRTVDHETDRAWQRLWHRHMGPRLGPGRVERHRLATTAIRSPISWYRRRVQHTYDLSRLQSLALSSGYAPRPAQQRRRAALLGDVEDFYREHASNQAVTLTFETVAALGRPRVPAALTTPRVPAASYAQSGAPV